MVRFVLDAPSFTCLAKPDMSCVTGYVIHTGEPASRTRLLILWFLAST